MYHFEDKVHARPKEEVGPSVSENLLSFFKLPSTKTTSIAKLEPSNLKEILSMEIPIESVGISDEELIKLMPSKDSFKGQEFYEQFGFLGLLQEDLEEEQPKKPKFILKFAKGKIKRPADPNQSDHLKKIKLGD